MWGISVTPRLGELWAIQPNKWRVFKFNEPTITKVYNERPPYFGSQPYRCTWCWHELDIHLANPVFFSCFCAKNWSGFVRRRNGRWLFSYMRWIEAMEILHSHRAGQDHLSIFSFFPLSQMNLHHCHRWQWMNPRKVSFVMEPVIDSLSCLIRWNCTMNDEFSHFQMYDR